MIKHVLLRSVRLLPPLAAFMVANIPATGIAQTGLAPDHSLTGKPRCAAQSETSPRGACTAQPWSTRDGASRPTLAQRLADLPHPAAIHIVDPRGRSQGAAAGLADPGGKRPITPATPLRIASNTKTFVAATVLRLWERRRIDLDAAIGPLLTPALDALLRADGYDTSRITMRHLLSHSGGLYDHGGDPRFIATALTRPDHVWTREELVRLSMSYADPQSAPGTEFRYSDTGYVLIGDIVERVTGLSLAAAVRRELKLDRLGLRDSWWEVMERRPGSAARRARQYLGQTDATDVHASMDLYGGGGLVMSARDLATFFRALFSGRVFDRPETLREMLWQGSHRGAATYRLGIFVKRAGGHDLYWHSGFWGTIAYYAPEAGIAAAGVTTNQQSFRALSRLVEEAVVSTPADKRRVRRGHGRIDRARATPSNAHRPLSQHTCSPGRRAYSSPRSRSEATRGHRCRSSPPSSSS